MTLSSAVAKLDDGWNLDRLRAVGAESSSSPSSRSELGAVVDPLGLRFLISRKEFVDETVLMDGVGESGLNAPTLPWYNLSLARKLLCLPLSSSNFSILKVSTSFSQYRNQFELVSSRSKKRWDARNDFSGKVYTHWFAEFARIVGFETLCIDLWYGARSWAISVWLHLFITCAKSVSRLWLNCLDIKSVTTRWERRSFAADHSLNTEQKHFFVLSWLV